MRVYQIGLQVLVPNIFGAHMFTILGMQCSPVGFAIGLMICCISLAIHGNKVRWQFLIEQLVMNTLYYAPLFQIHGLLAAAYAKVMMGTARCSVVPMVTSLVETTYRNFYLSRAVAST